MGWKRTLAVIAALAGAAVLAGFLERRGESQARAFCAQAAGRTATEVVAYAEAEGKRRPELQVTPQDIVVRFHGASPFPWHGCVIKVVGGRAVEAGYQYLD